MGKGDRKSFWVVLFIQNEPLSHVLDVTITLSFPRALQRDATTRYPPFTPIRGNSVFHTTQLAPPLEEVIDTHRPLPLRSCLSSILPFPAAVLTHMERAM